MVELKWDGKYDANGRRVAPLRLKLPFQTAETVNESAQERQRSLFNWGRQSEWRNRLIWGDKKYVLPTLLDEFPGQVDLVYIDPPFNVGSDFSFTAAIPDNPETDEVETTTFIKEPSIIEQKAYRDTWGRGLDSYLQWFYETVTIFYELLKEDGSIYVHLDWHVGHYAKAVMDEVFGENGFVNEIIWRRTAAHNDPGRYGNIHDVLFFYAKSPRYTWNQVYVPYSEDSIAASFSYAEAPDKTYIRLKKGESPPKGYRRFQTVTLRSPHPRPNLRYEYKGYKPHPNGWSCNIQRMEQYDREGRLFFPSSKEGALRLKMYLDESPGIPVQDLWVDIKKLEASSIERLDYVTQKPESLLERIIKASSNENDLVLDCFCGSGTTAAVAEKLNRRWITCDLGRFAIHTARKRLLSIENVRPFIVQNLGKYERQAWQAAEFGGEQRAAAITQQYRHFILELYQTRPIEGYSWLHGIKNGRMVHVGPVDSPITPNDITQIAIEFRKAMGTGKDAPGVAAVDVLGWDFAFELNEVAKQQAAQANITMRFIRIPREVLEKKAVEQGDIRFFELAALSVNVEKSGRVVTLQLTDFVIPPDDVPEDVQRAITHWSQWLDYWAVDWDNKGDTFHNQWQTYRTRQSKTLQLQVAHEYSEPGEYMIMVKAIDILGNDTTKTLGVKVV
jgi:adenine-specific DNA-methyltransferase